MRLRYSAYRRAEVNVANTYRESSLCYVLLVVSGKNRHINERLKTVDSFRQEEAGQGYVDLYRFKTTAPGEFRPCVDDLETVLLTR